MKPKQGLTPRQRDTVDAIAKYIKRYRCSPTLREIASDIGWSSHGAVRQMLDRIVERGHLRYKPNGRRTVILAE